MCGGTHLSIVVSTLNLIEPRELNQLSDSEQGKTTSHEPPSATGDWDETNHFHDLLRITFRHIEKAADAAIHVTTRWKYHCHAGVLEKFH